KIKGVTCAMPKGAFYAFPNVSELYGKRCNGKKIKGSSDLANYFLDKAQAAVVAGDAFGADDYIRFSYATSMDNIKKGIDRIEGAINSLD
ncbi:MAG: aspartate aminotransferase, partial [Nitrospirae bacterium]|nr:aspartate aminotransferase [Nitrospirota bacterium]